MLTGTFCLVCLNINLTANPSTMAVPAIHQEWINGMSESVGQVIAKTGHNALISKLPVKGWRLFSIAIDEKGKLVNAAIANKDIYAQLHSENESVLCRLEIPGVSREAWVFYFQFDGEKVKLVKFVEASMPGLELGEIKPPPPEADGRKP